MTSGVEAAQRAIDPGRALDRHPAQAAGGFARGVATAFALFLGACNSTPQPVLYRCELRGTVCACISRLAEALKPEYADALREIDVNGVPVHEYAAARAISSSNAAVRVFRARKALLGEVEATCSGCAKDGGCDDNCTCARHAV